MANYISNYAGAEIDAAIAAEGDRTYTEQNYVTDDETLTESVDAIDVALKAANNLVSTLSASLNNPIKRYGFRRTKAESNPATRITYLYDAVGLTPAYMDFAGGAFNYGSWETFVNEVQRPVMLKTDGTVDYELSRTDFTKKRDGITASDVSNTAYVGNAMIEFRKYKWVYQYEDANYEYFICCNVQYDANYKAYAFQNANTNIKDAFYWGAFKGIYSTNLRSIADQTVMYNQTRNTEVSRATGNGAGYYTIYKSGWDYIGNLLTLISKSDNSQTSFGGGKYTASSTVTGTTKSLPQFMGYNNATSDVKVFGIEGFWGNFWESMAGMILDTTIKTKLTPPYNFDATGYADTTITPSGTSGSYANTAKIDSEMGYVPKTANGSATTYYCDGLSFDNAKVCYALVSGYWNVGFPAGMRCIVVTAITSDTAPSIGSRLSYLNAL